VRVQHKVFRFYWLFSNSIRGDLQVTCSTEKTAKQPGGILESPAQLFSAGLLLFVLQQIAYPFDGDKKTIAKERL
jgi:hypothetical protein